MRRRYRCIACGYEFAVYQAGQAIDIAPYAPCPQCGDELKGKINLENVLTWGLIVLAVVVFGGRIVYELITRMI